MPRPRLRRHLNSNPEVTFFKPRGIPMRDLTMTELTHEEFEALRLKNVTGLDQTACAEKMQTSQSTFQRILSSAYLKISTALTEGHAIKIVK